MFHFCVIKSEKMKLKIYFLSLLFVLSTIANAQNKQLDSLQNVTKKLNQNPKFELDSNYLKTVNEIIAVFLN